MKLMNEEMKKDIQETTDQEQEPAGESVNTQEMGTQEEDTDQARCEQAETEESGGADNESEEPLRKSLRLIKSRMPLKKK